MINKKDYANLTPADYIKQQPIERQVALVALRQTILNNLPTGFKEYKVLCNFL